MNKQFDENEINQYVEQKLSSLEIFKKIKSRYNLEDQVLLLEKINQLNDIFPNQILVSHKFKPDNLEQNFYSIVFNANGKNYRVYSVSILEFFNLFYKLRTNIKNDIKYKSTFYFYDKSSQYRPLNKMEHKFVFLILKILNIRQD